MSESRSGTVTIVDDEAGDAVGVIELDDTERLEINDIKVAYSYEGELDEVEVTIYDEEYDEDDPEKEVDKELVEPGDRYASGDIQRTHIEDGVVVVADDDLDADVVVTIGGTLLT